MSIECDTSLFGVIRPPPEILQDRGKQMKSEPELQSEPKSEPELETEPKPAVTKPKPIWETKDVRDLKLSDFSIYDDDVDPFRFMCAHFLYRNKAQIQKEKEIEAAVADYRNRSRNLSVFDAIDPPDIAEYGICWVAVPLDMDDDRRRRDLTPLCKLALNKYNAENQGANFVFVDVVKTTWRAGGHYDITFQAVEVDPPNCPATTFQAQVRKRREQPHVVKSCSIKT